MTFNAITAQVGLPLAIHVITYISQIFYPVNNTLVGGGNQSDITFHAHTDTNFTFPFNIDYTKSNDPNNAVILDIGRKCGFFQGGTPGPIVVNYRLTVSPEIIKLELHSINVQLGLRIGLIVVSPVVSNSVSFACPFTKDQINVKLCFFPLSL